jgi:hypothetical protein
MDSLNREFFPGYADPDGRPWQWCGEPKNYRDVLEFNFKLALLTQKRLVMPRGYIFDNPGFQKLIENRVGNDSESDFFFKCISDLFVIATDETEGEKLDSKSAWDHQFLLWIGGNQGAESRNVHAHPNIVCQDNHVNDLTEIRDASIYREKFIKYNRLENKINLDKVFEALSSCKLRTEEPTYKFDFGYRVADQLINNPVYEIDKRVLEKLSYIHENNNNGRLSRSLLQNREKQLELVGENFIISSEEYRNNLMKPLRHYHHLSFANSFGSGCILSDIYVPSNGKFENAARRVSKSIGKEGFSVQGKLGSLTYENLFKLRSNYKFKESLTSLDETQGINESDYYKKLKQHWRESIAIMQEKSISLVKGNVVKVITGSISSPDTSSEINAVDAIKTILSVGAGIPKDIQLEYDMWRYWRKLEGERTQYLK